MSTWLIVHYHCMQFLSMKLAAVNPRLDFSIDDLLAKEVREMQISELLAYSYFMFYFSLIILYNNNQALSY